MRHQYLITVSDQTPRPEGAGSPPDLSFGFENHDDLFAIVERVRGKALFASEDETKTFCVGLKLLGEVLMQHRQDELFKDFAASFGTFMKALKAAP